MCVCFHSCSYLYSTFTALIHLGISLHYLGTLCCNWPGTGPVLAWYWPSTGLVLAWYWPCSHVTHVYRITHMTSKLRLFSAPSPLIFHVLLIAINTGTSRTPHVFPHLHVSPHLHVFPHLHVSPHLRLLLGECFLVL